MLKLLFLAEKGWFDPRTTSPHFSCYIHRKVQLFPHLLKKSLCWARLSKKSYSILKKFVFFQNFRKTWNSRKKIWKNFLYLWIIVFLGNYDPKKRFTLSVLLHHQPITSYPVVKVRNRKDCFYCKHSRYWAYFEGN